jgi:hypothetical protein
MDLQLLNLILTICLSVLVIWGKISGRAERRSVTFETAYASREELDQICASLRHLERKFEATVNDFRNAEENRIRLLHERVNEVLAAVAELRGEIKHLR